MAMRFSFTLFGLRISLPLGKGRMRIYGNTARKNNKQGDGNPRLSYSKDGKGVSVPLNPKKRRGIGWWL